MSRGCFLCALRVFIRARTGRARVTEDRRGIASWMTIDTGGLYGTTWTRDSGVDVPD